MKDKVEKPQKTEQKNKVIIRKKFFNERINPRYRVSH